MYGRGWVGVDKYCFVSEDCICVVSHVFDCVLSLSNALVFLVPAVSPRMH